MFNNLNSFLLFFILWCVYACGDKPENHTEINIISEYDNNIPKIIKAQVFDSMSPYYGAIPDINGIHHPISCAGFIHQLSCTYFSPESKYFQDENLKKRMIAAMDYLNTCQHEDGTIDLLSTNFHSTPDLAFAVEPLAMAYKLLLKTLVTDDHLLNKMKTFLYKAGNALSVGGIHTPNHRWVVCMALARIHEIFPNEKYITRINQWLAEGIDIDIDGQYNEKSTYVYSPVTNKALITIARILKRDELYEPVRKNLRLTQYLIHTNGELVTETSRRQDQYTVRQSDVYYYAYKFMGMHDKDSLFLSMAASLKAKFGEKLELGLRPQALEDSILFEKVDSIPGIAKYDSLFIKQGIARWSDNVKDASVINANSSLFSLHYGDAVLQSVRFASAFFGKGQFKADSILKIKNGYRLVQNLLGPYYQPFPADSIKKYYGDWDKMPKQNRQKSEVQKIRYQLDATRIESTWKLTFNVTGTEAVPCAVEINFRPEGELIGVEKSSRSQDVYFLTDSIGIYSYKNKIIEFRSGIKKHEWTEIRGAEPKAPGKSVYITGYTPFLYTLEIEAK